MLNIRSKTYEALRVSIIGSVLTGTCGVASADVTATNISSILAAAGYGASLGSVGVGINASGQIVGYYNVNDSSGSQVPFVYTPTGPNAGVTALTQITPGFTTQASAINNSGLVVGAGTVGGSLNGFVYNTATQAFTTVTPGTGLPATPGDGTSNVPTKTFFNAVNAAGIAVGYVGYNNFSNTMPAYRGMTYNTATGVGADVGSPFSGPVVPGNSTSNQNIITAISDTGVLAGYGPNTNGVGGNSGASVIQKYFTATPTGTGSYAYNDFTPAISRLPAYTAPSGGFMGINSAGYIAGTHRGFTTTTRFGFLYNATTGTAVQIDLNNSAKANANAFADVDGTPVVGGGAFTGTTNRAFLSINGAVIDVSTALAGTAFSTYTLGSVNAINANGDVVAVGTASGSFVPTTFLLSNFVSGFVAPTTAYFTGAASGSLNAKANFTTDSAGTAPVSVLPAGNTDVNFASTNAAAANLAAATVTGPLPVRSLTFGPGASAGNPITIAGTGTINIAAGFYPGAGAYAAGVGIVKQSGSAAVAINAPVFLAASQSWTNSSSTALTVGGAISTNGSTLTIAGTNAGGTTLGGVVSGAGAVAVTAGGLTTLTGANTYTGGITVNTNSGTLLVGPSASTPLLTGSGTNVAAGTIEIQYSSTSPAATIRTLLLASFTAASTPGVIDTGTLRSSTASAMKGLGYKESGAGSVIVKATLYGDADLDGGVSINDFNALAGNFGQSTGKVWVDGDFDYDGGISINDFNLLAGNFGKTLPPGSEAWAGLLAFAAANNDLAAFEAVTGVPEPTGLGLIAAGATMGLRRRRRWA